MSTRTFTAPTDLTYEEIYEGHASGRSKLPKLLNQIRAGDVAIAETTGVEIKRRRTLGGNANYRATQVGQTDTTVVAKLVSADRLEALLAGYSGAGGFVTPPTYFEQEVNVRQMVKDTYDLLDQVAGRNFAEQSRGSAGLLSGRQAKLQEKGTYVQVREITYKPTGAATGATADLEVTDYYPGDRIGSGGATGEFHGVDQGIEDTVLTTTVGTVDDVFDQTILDLSDDAVEDGTTLRYATAQFGVLKIVDTTNGLETPETLAYVVHPDFLEDLISYQ